MIFRFRHFLAALMAAGWLFGAQAAESTIVAGQPVVGRNANGHLDVFSVDAEGQLRQRWLKQSNGDWSSWSRVGEGVLPGLAVTCGPDGLMRIFAVANTDGAIKYATQVSSNTPSWSAWSELPGAKCKAGVMAAQAMDGRLVLFAVASDSDEVLSICQTNAAGGWSKWMRLGGGVGPELAVEKNRDGRLELFAIGVKEKNLVHCWELEANGVRGWSEWMNLGGSNLAHLGAGLNADGRMEVFVADASGDMSRICQIAPGSSRRWTDWLEFDARVKSGFAVGQSLDLRLELVAINAADGMLLHRWQNRTDGSDEWSAWAPMDMRAQGSPAVGQNEEGNLEVFALDANDSSRLNHRRQVSKASDWLDWSSLDRTTFLYSSKRWQIDEGLPNNSVQAIAQTSDGYLWVGTPAGLARFDGVAFTVFNSRNTPGLKNSSITALCADRRQALWIGTDGAGLFRLKDGALEQFSQAQGLCGDALRVVYESRDGSIWAGTTNGISRIRDNGITNFHKKDGLLSDLVTSIYEDRAGALWIATGAGLNRLREGAMDSFAMPKGLPNDSVRGICQDRGGRLWIGSNNGMLWFNSYWTNFYAYNTRYGISDAFVSAICEDREGNLWVGTYSGLNRFREGRFFNELDNEGVPYDKVNTLFEDRESNLWVGTYEGLIRLTPKRFFTYTKRQGLSHNNVASVREGRDGGLWVGVWGGGLDLMKDEKVVAYTSSNGLPNDLILATYEAHDGSLWIGLDADGGLSHFKEGQFKSFSRKDGLPDAPIRVIHEDRARRLWIGTGAGLYVLTKGRFGSLNATNGFTGKVVFDICEDRKGDLWFGSDRGLHRWKNGAFTNYVMQNGLSDNKVLALMPDDTGDLWVGTSEGGLNRFRDGRVWNYRSRDGLFSDEILEILEDNDGWLWMTCSRGIFRVRKADLDRFDRKEIRTLSCLVYGASDGLESTHCNGLAQPAGWKTRDGHLWFPTSKGLVTIDPASSSVSSIPPPVYVESFVADRRPVFNDAALTSIPGEPPSKHLRVSPGRGELEFHYTALSLQAPESIRFKFKLEGLNPDWIEVGNRRVAYYNNVPPGNYRFCVAACNKDGLWSEAEAALLLELRPHAWQTGWLRSLAAVSVIALAGGIARYMTTRRMQRKLELIEQRHAVERERGRIARDIHDELGSSLTRIMMLGERAQEGLGKSEDVGNHVTKIVSSARDTVQSLDEIVWAVNPENDSLNGLVEYITHYADEMFEETDVRCRLEFPATLSSQPLGAEIRHDLFLVVKEALHNILRHSGASEVHIRVWNSETTLEVGIQDNGCGFNPDLLPSGRGGNGLENMRKRLKSIGGQLLLRSEPGKGTSLVITILLAPKGQAV